MTVQTKQELMCHLGHDIEVTYYGEKSDPVSVTIECITCGSVLVNFEDHTDYDAGADSYTPYELGQRMNDY